MSSPASISHDIPKEARNWAMACHLMAFTGCVSGLGFLLGPLITWLIKKEEHPYIDAQGKEAVNFQITMFIAMMCCIPLLFIVIGFVILPVLAIINLVYTIIGAVNAADGRPFEYPLSVRFFQ